MRSISISHLIVGIAMLGAAGLAVALKPSVKVADQGDNIHLETMIPKQFGEWKLDESIAPLQVSPDVQAQLGKIYNQTLSRTYINPQGRRIMLSIAYGGDQSDSLQVHRPEVCYTQQGFHVVRDALSRLATKYGELPVKRLTAVQRERNEPITYWITVGDKVTYAGLRRKLAQLGYGLTGTIPDGMLVRVSSIDRDEERAYQVQEDFVREMLAAVSDKDRLRLIGRFGA